MTTRDYIAYVIASAVFVLTIAFVCGCASMYQPRMTTVTLPAPLATSQEMISAGDKLTTFEQWTSLWGSVCGAIITAPDGNTKQVIPGTCGTPLTLFMNSPMNYGLAGLAINHP